MHKSRQLIYIVLLLTILIPFIFYMGKKGIKQTQNHYITALSLESDSFATLKAEYFAELLDLSIDKPTKLLDFNLIKATNILVSNPLIKKVKIKKIPPETIHIQYSMRKPLAYLEDFYNTAFDEEGVLFPVDPFFTPKNIPYVRIGFEDLSNPWGKKLDSKQIGIVVDLLQQKEVSLLTEKITKIDLAHAWSIKLGTRQIVIVLKKNLSLQNAKNECCYIRYSLANQQNLLEKYSLIKKLAWPVNKKIIVFDLRFPSMALISDYKYR